jgi:hypothetical protein
MPRFNSHIHYPTYFNPTHSITLLTLCPSPIWIGFVLDPTYHWFLDIRWHYNTLHDPLPIFARIDQFCTDACGQRVDLAHTLPYTFSPDIVPIFNPVLAHTSP